VVATLTGCRSLQATNNADWSPDQKVLPTAEYHGKLLTVHNVRNCEYRSTTDYTVSPSPAVTIAAGGSQSNQLTVTPAKNNAALTTITAHATSGGFSDINIKVQK